MNSELLLEIGCEEIPASWLPDLTNQIGDVVSAQLREHRLAPESPAETFSTPRRLTVWIARVPERQTDLEELVNGPPVSASFKPDGTPTPAAAGFAAKQGVDVSALERVTTPKGEYIAFRKRQRGKTTVDVLPDVLGGTLRRLTFPKLMHWDALLDDGKGDLLFGRPIRWILYCYGGRVVPFTISRTPAAQSSLVQDVSSGAVTYGHRFLTTSGRAGRAIKVRSFDEYRARLLENFVILERGERHDKIARELDAKAQRLKGRVSRTVHNQSGLLDEVPDLVEYPSVIAGTFASEFTEALPDEVLTTTLIHHQHYFPVEGEDGRLKPAFLAVINTEPDNERTIARNAERVVTARLRDALFFWEADRRTTLASRIERLSTLLFHKKLGTYREKTERIERLAWWIAGEAFGASADVAKQAAAAARLAKADLTTDMVREFTELQGVMGGIYAREEALPEEVWKAIYFHYLPVAVEAEAAPTRAQLGKAAVTWAAVSLADKIDTIVGLFEHENPTGSRDPYALRRAAHGVVKVLVDLEAVTGIAHRPLLSSILDQAFLEQKKEAPEGESRNPLRQFFMDRFRHLCRERGFEYEEIQVVTGRISRVETKNLSDLFEDVTEWKTFIPTPACQALAEAHKRAKGIVERELEAEDEMERNDQIKYLRDDVEVALRRELDRVAADIDDALNAPRQPRKALNAIASIQPAVALFFEKVHVVVEDDHLKNARLSMLKDLRDAVEKMGDPSSLAQRQQ